MVTACSSSQRIDVMDAASPDGAPADGDAKAQATAPADARPPLVDPASPSGVSRALFADSGLSAADQEKLCRWGQDVLGGEGTVYQAPCIVAAQDAGAPQGRGGRTPLRVQSIAACEQRLRAPAVAGAYTVGQFEDCVRLFRNDECGAGACHGLIDYVR
jgi:hypothetical protein